LRSKGIDGRNVRNDDTQILGFATRLLATVLVVAAMASAQPSFAVASVKLNTSADRSSFTRQGEDSLVLLNWPLRDIVLKAYDLKNYALAAPNWLASRIFDI
jgi:hypothetical protein